MLNYEGICVLKLTLPVRWCDIHDRFFEKQRKEQ